ncbi:MAG TPA: glycosyltransferase family 4 protein [Solirubrobacteraceae bacterium]
MDENTAGLRIAGVSLTDVSDFRQPVPPGKWSQIFSALAQRATIVGTVSPELPRSFACLGYARNFYPSKERWLAQTGLDLRRAAKLTASAGRRLGSMRESYDLILQLQTLFAPGSPAPAPYVIYTDNTFALTRRFYPEWAPLTPRRAAAWRGFEADVCRAALRVFTFSEFARSSVVDDYGCDPLRVAAIGAGANQFAPSVAGKDYSRPLALFVGRPFGLKGGPTLLEAWATVRARLPGAELIVAGPRGAAPSGLGPGITWLGRVDRSALARLYTEASVFVLPTMYDAWGHVFLEAMGHGLPCIGTNICAIPEIIDDGATGRLVPRGDPRSLADALLELLTDPELARRMGAAAHAKVRERMTWNHVAERLLGELPDRVV